MSAKSGKFSGIRGEGTLHGGGESFHSEEQGADGGVPGPSVLRQRQALPRRGPSEGKPYDDILSSVPSVEGDPARDLATVHHICESHLPELVDISREMSQIKTLVTVTEMLSKHKQKYTEMLAGQGGGGGS